MYRLQCMYLAPVSLHDSLNKIDYRFLIYGKTLTWTNFVTERKNLIPKYVFNRPSALKRLSLFNKNKHETIRKLCKLIDIMNKKISSPWKKNPSHLC
jgi:hypothetical protein